MDEDRVRYQTYAGPAIRVPVAIAEELALRTDRAQNAVERLIFEDLTGFRPLSYPPHGRFRRLRRRIAGVLLRLALRVDGDVEL